MRKIFKREKSFEWKMEKWNQAKWKMKTYYNNYNYSILTFEVILTCTDVSQKCIEQNKSINCDLNCCFGTPLMLIVCISDKMLHCTWGASALCHCSIATTHYSCSLSYCCLFLISFLYLFRTHPCHHNLNPPKTRGSQYNWNFFRSRAFFYQAEKLKSWEIKRLRIVVRVHSENDGEGGGKCSVLVVDKVIDWLI